jgi:ABC-type transport system involved in multi-copper enzyme maturation permease subunit
LTAADPVALKELRGVSRKWQTYVGRCLFVGITAYLLYEYWKEAWHGRTHLAASVSISEVARLGREIFVRCEGVSIALTVLAAVLAASDMLAREIRDGTLGILLLTDLTPQRVVLGKFKAAMMIAVALYLCSLPVLAIAVYLGGVGPQDLVRSTVFTLGLAAVGASVSLAYSARLKSGGAAVAATIPLMILWTGATFAADALGRVFYENLYGSAFQVHKGGVATAALALGLCAVYLGRALGNVREKTGMIPGPAELAREQRGLRLGRLRDERGPRPKQRMLRTWRAVWDSNPLLWKEFTLRPALRIREDWRTRAYVILFFFFLISWVMSAAGGNGFFNVWGGFFTVIALAGGSLLFAPEKEGRQWLLLLSTPVTPVQVVRAKLLCGLIFPEAMGMLLLYGLSLVVWLGFQTIYTFVTFSAAATLFILFSYALAASVSLRSKTARGAFMTAAGIVAFLVTVPALLSAAVRPLYPSTSLLWNELWTWFEALDPVTVLASFDVVQHPRDIPSRAIDLVVRFFILYLPVTLLLPVEMVWRFRRIAIRA